MGLCQNDKCQLESAPIDQIWENLSIKLNNNAKSHNILNKIKSVSSAWYKFKNNKWREEKDFLYSIMMTNKWTTVVIINQGISTNAKTSGLKSMWNGIFLYSQNIPIKWFLITKGKRITTMEMPDRRLLNEVIKVNITNHETNWNYLSLDRIL